MEMPGLFGGSFGATPRHQRVSILELGGTAAGQREKEGISPSLTFSQIVDRAFGAEAETALGEIFVPPFGSRRWHFGKGKESAEISFPDLMCIVDRLYHHVLATGGVVGICGTDRLADVLKTVSTMLIHPPVPVVLTGSQKTLDEEGNDVRRNIEDAVYCARKLLPGFYVVFGGKIINALDAHKYSTERIDGFQSSSGKYVGQVNARQGIFILEPLTSTDVEMKKWLIEQGGEATFCSYQHSPDVMIFEPPIGASPKLLRSLLEMDSLGGAVLKIPGLGGLDRDLGGNLKDLAKTKPIVLATSSPHGRTDLGVYSLSNGLEADGFISARHLSASAAAIFLQRWIGLMGEERSRITLGPDQDTAHFIRSNFHDINLMSSIAAICREHPWQVNMFRQEMVKHGYADPDDALMRDPGD